MFKAKHINVKKYTTNKYNNGNFMWFGFKKSKVNKCFAVFRFISLLKTVVYNLFIRGKVLIYRNG